jgi:hypothetical protein
VCVGGCAHRRGFAYIPGAWPTVFPAALPFIHEQLSENFCPSRPSTHFFYFNFLCFPAPLFHPSQRPIKSLRYHWHAAGRIGEESVARVFPLAHPPKGGWDLTARVARLPTLPNSTFGRSSKGRKHFRPSLPQPTVPQPLLFLLRERASIAAQRIDAFYLLSGARARN